MTVMSVISWANRSQYMKAATGQQTLQRTNCGAAAPNAASWNIAVTSTDGATPGNGPLNTGKQRICVSEVGWFSVAMRCSRARDARVHV